VELAGVPSVIPKLQSCKYKTTTMLRMVFLFLFQPFSSKLSKVSIKTKTPVGVVVFYLIVERIRPHNLTFK